MSCATDDTPPPSLTTLDEELVLKILQSFRRGTATPCLCRLEATCQFFHRRSALSPADESLSLPEYAALIMMRRNLALPVRPDGLQPIRPYQRGADESHKQVLQLLEQGLLTRGVLHGVPVTAVEGSGWKLAYAAPYAHRTRDSDLESVPPNARFVMAAAINVGRNASGDSHVGSVSARLRSMLGVSDKLTTTAAQVAGGSNGCNDCDTGQQAFHLLAWGKRETVLAVTHQEHIFEGMGTTTDNEEESVYWYRWPNSSFGFSSDPNLWLWAADAGIKQRGLEERSEDRLSWNLDLRSTGGWRAGRVIDLGNSREWEKRLYYRL